jgi:hypothetical protein
MSKILTELLNACDPMAPARAEHYVSCTEVRGGNVFAEKVVKELHEQEGISRFLFSGHIGSGKSSELRHLQDCLEAKNPPEGFKRFFVVYLNIEESVDVYDVSLSDILLSIASELASQFRERLDIHVEDSFLMRRLAEAWRFFQRDIEPGETEVSTPPALPLPDGKLLPLPQLKQKFQLLRTDPTARQQVRERLLPQMTSLLFEINQVFSKARIELKKHRPQPGEAPYFDFLLVIDNLEKIARFNEEIEMDKSQKALFVDGAVQLNGLQAHAILTVPLTLARAQGKILQGRYGREPFVLPMIKTEHRPEQTAEGTKHEPYTKGRARLRQVLTKRTPEPLEKVITEEALDYLLRYCGGNIRQFIMTVREASLYADAAPIPLSAAKEAVRQQVPIYATSIGRTQWAKLAALERSEEPLWDQTDPDTANLLEQWYILEYINGGTEESDLEAVEPWYAVHPIVRELSAFKSALRTIDMERAEKA